jgi:hypothetical protein
LFSERLDWRRWHNYKSGWKVLLANDITSMKFFINAVNTITKGVDVVKLQKFRDRNW